MDLDSKTPDVVIVDQKDQTINVPGELEVANKPIDVLNKLSEEEKKQKELENKNSWLEFYKRSWLKKHNIEGVDLEKEIELIQKKESSLSRSKRDAVVAAIQIFPVMEKQMRRQNEIEDLPVGTPLTKEEAEAAIAEANKEADKSAE